MKMDLFHMVLKLIFMIVGAGVHFDMNYIGQEKLHEIFFIIYDALCNLLSN